MPRVTLTYHDHVAHVTLNRADKMNAVDTEMSDAIIAVGRELMDSHARAVVLAGEGASFCAGLDVSSLAKLSGSDPHALLEPRTHGNANDFQELAMIWHRLPMPVIVALQGAVYGAGFQIALGADMRIAAPDARFAVMEMKWGLVPDMGAMVLLPRLTRSDVIRYLTYTAEPISAEQARDWGIVTEVTADPLARAQELATLIASKSPSAIEAAKRLITYAESGAAEDDILLAESCEQADLIGNPHQRETISANMSGRAPVYE